LDLAGELDADLLSEQASELETERLLPDFDWAGDLDADLDLLRDGEHDLELVAERDLDRLFDFE